jgi:ABC-type multidrug transport system ATPase subunit
VLAALNLSPGTSGHRSTDHHKSYGGTVGLGDVSCTAQEGEIVAIPGPGGAGQTTTAGYIRGPGTPGSGRAGVPGLNPGT